LRADGRRWCESKNPYFFLPQIVVAARFRNRLKTALQAQEDFDQIPSEVWRQKWIVDVQPVGSGEPAIKYLSAYVYRTALGSQRILADQDGQITFQYKDSRTQQWCTLTLGALEFIRRFLQHVLPQGLQRVRYYGWLAAAATARWQRILALLDWQAPARLPAPPRSTPLCPHCGAPLVWIGTLSRAPP